MPPAAPAVTRLAEQPVVSPRLPVLTARGSVERLTSSSGEPAWLVSGYELVKEFLADPRLDQPKDSECAQCRDGARNRALDQHAHDHGVYVLHGCARLRLGDDEYELNAGDIVYIPGNEVHQFFTSGNEPFGFLCIVPAQR